jgi:hypothetical protein
MQIGEQEQIHVVEPLRIPVEWPADTEPIPVPEWPVPVTVPNEDVREVQP